VFNALANPTRRAIVVRLAAGDASVSELAEPFDVSLRGMAKHLRVLEHAGLVDQHKQGRVRRCRLRAAPMRFARRPEVDLRPGGAYRLVMQPTVPGNGRVSGSWIPAQPPHRAGFDPRRVSCLARTRPYRMGWEGGLDKFEHRVTGSVVDA
jgi:DNA-binding transcriptional ArsR family regulator